MIVLQLRRPLTFMVAGSDRKDIDVPSGVYVTAHSVRFVKGPVNSNCYFDVYTCEGGHYKWMVTEAEAKHVSPLECLAAQAPA